jgi:hypothetical protein
MTFEWRAWAQPDGDPILAVQRGRDGVQRCTDAAVLEPE